MDIARRLRIAPSTIHHWAKEAGFRRKDVKARASLAHGPRFPGKADYLELKKTGPRARLERMQELAGEASFRAVAAIEAGFLDYGLKWLREVQKLKRGWTVLREHLADYPTREEEEAASWQDHRESSLNVSKKRSAFGFVLRPKAALPTRKTSSAFAPIGPATASPNS